MIDLHSHILCGIDDGPAMPEGSMELARSLAADGVSTVAATPHLRGDYPAVIPGELAERTGELQEQIDSEGLSLTVVPGGEADLVWALEASDDELRDASFAGRGTDLMVETPYAPLPSTFEELLFRVQVRGMRILLAHPERNPSFQEEPERLAAITERGVLLQVTASSLARSQRGSRSASLAQDLVREGLAHVIASDSHGAAVADRAPLSAGLETASELIGPRATWMVEDAPAAVLEGRPLPEAPQPAEAGPRRGLLSRLLG